MEKRRKEMKNGFLMIRRKIKRTMAVALSILLVASVIDYSGFISARAETQKEAGTITAFAGLSGEIASQQLAVGAEESTITLPDTLEVTIETSPANTPDSVEGEAQPDEAALEESQPDKSVDAETAVAVTSADSQNNAAEPQAEAGEAEGTTDSNAEAVVDSGAAPTVETTTGAAPAVETMTGDASDVGTENAEQELSKTTQTVTLEGITWKIDTKNSISDTFDSHVKGAYYIYMPVLPSGYTVVDGVSLPEISVQIGSGIKQLKAGESAILIGGVTVDSADWYATTDTSGTVTPEGASADNWNVHVEIQDGDTPTATVTLNNATIVNSNDAGAISVSDCDLNIVLEGTANQIGTDATSYGYAIYNSTGGSVAITGVGDLTVKGNYGVYVNGDGNVDIAINGSLCIESQWQMVWTSGTLTVEAQSINMDGYYIYGSSSSSLTATAGDVVVTGDSDYGIQADKITISAPQGAVSVTGNYHSLRGGDTGTISVSAKNDVALTGIVYGSSVSISSGNGDITLNSNYQTIQGVSDSVTLSAPQGDITLSTTSEYVSIISGSSYALTITAGGALDVQCNNGIAYFSTADIKAQSVKISATGNGYGYGLIGGQLSITNPEGGNCTEVYISGGRGNDDRDAIKASSLTIKADKVMIIADSTASHAVCITGDAAIVNAGMIAGAVSVGGTKTIAPGILQVNAVGADASAGLDLSTGTPTQSTYYKAGDGYALYTPAQGITPATLVLHNASISANGYAALKLGEETVIQLEGTNSITNSNTETGTGITALNSEGNEQPLAIQGGSGDSLTVSAWQCTRVDNLTISGGNVTMNGLVYGMNTEGNVLLQNSAQVSVISGDSGAALNIGYITPYDLTVTGSSALTTNGRTYISGNLTVDSGSTITTQTGDEFWVNSATAITNNGTIHNNGIFVLPYSYTAEQVEATNIPGTIKLYDSETDTYKVYVDGEFYVDGGKVTGYLDLSTPPGEATYYEADTGYCIFTPAQDQTPAVLALTNATIDTDADVAIDLPSAAVTMQLSGKNTLRSNEGDGIWGYASLTITSSNGGTLDIESDRYAMNFEDAHDSTITIGGNASVTAVSYKSTAVMTPGNLTVEPIAKFAAKGMSADVVLEGNFNAPNFNGSVAVGNLSTAPKTVDITIYGTCDIPGIFSVAPIGTSQIGAISLHIPSGSQMTIPSGSSLMVTDMIKLDLDGKIINNGMIYLPVGTTASQIKAMNLTGTGGVFVMKSIDVDGMPSKDDGDAYTNDGKPLKYVGDDLSLDSATEIPASENKGYTWTKSGEGDSEVWTLDISGTFILGNIILPDNKAITIHCTEDTVIDGAINAGQEYKCNLIFTGSGILNIGNGILNGIGGTITVKDGAHLITGRLSFGGSGNTDSTLNVIGKGSTLTATDTQGSAISVETVNVQDGAKLITKADTVGVMAGKGGVSITGGSTLTAGCDYGVYIINGKLTVDDDSKLITNGAIAPFCIIDTKSNKAKDEVLALTGKPDGTEIKSVQGNTDFSGYLYTYWSLVPTNGSLSVDYTSENTTPVTLIGAKTGTLTFVKAATPSDNNNNGDGGSGDGGNGDSGSTGGNTAPGTDNPTDGGNTAPSTDGSTSGGTASGTDNSTSGGTASGTDSSTGGSTAPGTDSSAGGSSTSADGNSTNETTTGGDSSNSGAAGNRTATGTTIKRSTANTVQESGTQQTDTGTPEKEPLDDSTLSAGSTDSTNQTEDTTEDGATKASEANEDSGSMMAMWILLVIIVVIVMGGTIIYIRKKQDEKDAEKEEEL